MRKVILGLLLVASILWLPPAKSATLEEVQQLIDEVLINCNVHHQNCSVRLIDHPREIAATNYDTITISTATINLFNKEELRSVMYHELAHAVLNHSERGYAYSDRIRQQLERDLTYNEMQKLRHQMENEADSYASLLLYFNNKPNKLDTALVKLGMKYKRNFDEDYLTHPSTNSRLRNIRRYKILYGN